jgi:prolyl-tRNA editing enzyme YbaK/EbsC (Cys-tRNA(Pro) deacylase)
MKDALTIHRALLGWETAHEIVRLPLSMTWADELPRALGLPPDRCLVTRVYSCEGGARGRSFLAGAIVPAGRWPSAEAVRRGVGARGVRHAHADVVNAVTEYAAGLVCPLLLPDSMPLLIDRGLVDGPHAGDIVYTATGEASTALGIKADVLYSLCRAKPADLLAPRGAAPAPGLDHATT